MQTLNAQLLSFPPMAQKPANFFDNENSGIRLETVTLEEFSEYRAISCQRDVELRANRVKKMLKKKWLQTHGMGDVVEYPDGSRDRINGNTRVYAWTQPYDGPVPSHINVTVYPVKNEEEAKALYYTIDSSDAVEKSRDKITGFYRQLGLQFNTRKIAAGNIVKCLEYAAWNTTSQRDVHGAKSPTQVDARDAVEYFQDELVALDSIGFKGSNKSFNTSVITAFLMSLKTFGASNERLLSGLMKLKNQERGPSSPKTGTDGITKIIEECIEKKQFSEGLKTDAIALPRQLDFFLYCITKFMEGENVKQYRRPSSAGSTGKGRRASLYTTWWDDNE